MKSSGSLPYTDHKPVGAADFYFGINATFRFIETKFGLHGLRAYWSDLGSNYFAPVSKIWKEQGLDGVAAYWKSFFAAEPGAEVEVVSRDEKVEINVKVCPAIRHLREHQREIVPCFCQHCYFINEAIAAPAGFTARVDGGNGSCRQVFFRACPNAEKQDLSRIKEARC